jgi:hypothetical protein
VKTKRWRSVAKPQRGGEVWRNPKEVEKCGETPKRWRSVAKSLEVEKHNETLRGGFALRGAK